jgi:enterochelin esterase family protein
MEELSFASRAYGDERDVLVYQPARMRSRRRYPLLVVHDGFDYMRFSDLRVVLDNLIHRLEIEPMVVALTSSSNRLEESADDSRQAAFLAEDLLPILEERYPLVGEPRGRALMGASFGAVASLSAAWRRQGTWGSLLLQSGSFVFTDIGQHDRGPVFDRVVRFVNEFRANPGRPAQRVFQTCGTYESMIYYNRSLVPLFQATGMELRYSEARDGHNWENWRDRLREGLSWLFPGPLWMVYE